MEKVTYRGLLHHVKDICDVTFGRTPLNEKICDRKLTVDMDDNIQFLITTDRLAYYIHIILKETQEELCWVYLLDDNDRGYYELGLPEDDVTVELHCSGPTNPGMYLNLDDEVPSRKDYNNGFFKGERVAMEALFEFANYERDKANLWGNYFPDMNDISYNHQIELYKAKIKDRKKTLKSFGISIPD
jgi:hypothetical protein